MADEDIGLDLLTRTIVNGASDGVVAALAAMGGSGKGRLGED